MTGIGSGRPGDTNIILRRIHRAHPQYRQARDAITKFSSAGNRVCVTSQNLVELWAVCTRPIENNGLGLTPAQADRIVGRVEASVFRLPDSDNVYTEWRRLVVAHGVTHILTFNADDFSRYPGITVLDPTKD